MLWNALLRSCVSHPSVHRSALAYSKSRIVAHDGSSIKNATQIILLVVAVLFFFLFTYWMDFQIKRGRPALIPNYFWKELAFSSICLIVFLTWAIVQTLEYFFSL